MGLLRSLSSDATSETRYVDFLRQLRTSVTTSDGGARPRMLARSTAVYQTLVSVWAHARGGTVELGFQDTKVSSIPSSNRSRPASLVSCVRGGQYEATRTTDPTR
jgi:hypothetical protein